MDWFMIQIGKLIVFRFFVSLHSESANVDFTILQYFDWPRLSCCNAERGLFRIEYDRDGTSCELIVSILWLNYNKNWKL